MSIFSDEEIKLMCSKMVDNSMLSVMINSFQEKADNSSGDYHEAYNDVIYYLSRAVSRLEELEG